MKGAIRAHAWRTLIAGILSWAVLPCSANGDVATVVPTGEGQFGFIAFPGEQKFSGTWTAAMRGGLTEVTSAATYLPSFPGGEASIFVHRDGVHPSSPTVPLFPFARPATNVALSRPGSAFSSNLDDTDDFHLFSFTRDGSISQTYAIDVVNLDRNGGLRWLQTIDNIETTPFPDDFLQSSGVVVDQQGRVTVAYTNVLGGLTPQIEARRFDAQGDPIGGAFGASLPGRIFGDIGLRDPAGDEIVVVGTDFSNILGNVVDLSGPAPSLLPEFPISTTPAGVGNLGPSLGVDPVTGAFTVAWEFLSGDQGDPNNVRARRFDGQGDPIGDDFLVNTTTANAQGQVDVARGPGGVSAIVWAGDGADPPNDFLDTFIQVFDANGNPIGGEIRTNPAPANSQQFPQVTFLPKVDSEGRPQCFVGWCDLVGDGSSREPVGTGFSYQCYAVEGMATDPNDLDGDGLPNDYEDLFGLDKNDPTDAHGDLDNDGLDNTAEFNLGTIPNNPDTDGDGLLDGDPREPNPLLSDSDFDSVNDGTEVNAGYDPLDLHDTFRIGSIAVDQVGEIVTITLPASKIGKTYSLLEIDFDTELFIPVPGQQGLAGNGGDLIFEDGFESGDVSVWSVSSP